MVRSTNAVHPIVEESVPLSAITPSGLEEDYFVRLSVEQLKKVTDNFSKENLIGVTMCGKLYRGKISTNSKVVQHVTVKIWAPPPVKFIYRPKHIFFPDYDNFPRLSREVFLLRHPSLRNHPNFVKLFGYTPPPIHRAGQPIGVVYDINPIDTLHNLIPRDDFTWSQRIKDYNPVLSDFGLSVGGIFGRKPYTKKDFVYTGTEFFEVYNDTWDIDTWKDVHNFGAILLSLIGKRSVDVTALSFGIDVSIWAEKSYKRSLFSYLFNKSLAHKSFKDDPNFCRRDAHKITELAMSCMGLPQLTTRPTMKKVVKLLLAFNI